MSRPGRASSARLYALCFLLFMIGLYCAVVKKNLVKIVISLGSLALLISICIRIYDKYGTFDITEIRRLRG